VGTIAGIGRAVHLEGQQLAVFVLIILLAAFFSLLTPGFISARSLDNILRTASMYGIVALGMTLVIITAGIDLSVASLMALAGVVAAGLMGTAFGAANPFHVPVLVALLIALLVTGVLGLVNGTLISRLNLAPFVVTLGMLSVARGLTFIFGNFVVRKVSGTAITFSNPVFDWLGSGTVGPIPSQTALFIVIALAAALVLRYTHFGRSVFAIGGNIEDARLAGIKTSRVLMAVYAISGVLAGLGGLILTGRLSSAAPLAASGYELNVIMIVVIGGTSLVGGRGSILGTVLGAILISEIDNGMNLLNVPSFNQFLIKGTLLVAAVVVDKLYQRRGLRGLRLTTG
jgi:ribose/xylose/arabinose/galactoside ABC-type transport system permease subunit